MWQNQDYDSIIKKNMYQKNLDIKKRNNIIPQLL